MSRYTAAIDVPLSLQRAFDLWTDAARFPQWQSGVLRVLEPSGRPRAVGSSVRLEIGPGMARTATILDSDPPALHVVRQAGFGSADETTAAFEALGPERTRVSVHVDLTVRLLALGRVLERLTRGQTQKQLVSELGRFAEVAARSLPDFSPGSLVTIDCGAGYRVAKIIESEPGRIHLALIPGVSSQRPSDIESFLDNESQLLDPLALKPLQPRLRRVVSMAVRGQPLLALDGGIGVPHLALASGAFADALPQVAGAIRVFPEEQAEVKSWRAAEGPVLGEDLDAAILPIVSLRDDEEYRVAKILRVDRLAVHLRMYSNWWSDLPDEVDPWSLRMDRHDAELPGIGHLPVTRASFAQWAPGFQRLAMVGSAELDGLRDWEASGGGVFG